MDIAFYCRKQFTSGSALEMSDLRKKPQTALPHITSGRVSLLLPIRYPQHSLTP